MYNNTKKKILIYTPYANPNKTGKAMFNELFFNNVYLCICGNVRVDSILRYGKNFGVFNNADDVAMLRCLCDGCNVLLLINTTQIISDQNARKLYGEICIDSMYKKIDEPTGNEVLLLIDVAYIFNVVNAKLRKYKINRMLDYTKYLNSILIQPIIQIINTYLQFGYFHAHKLSEYEETKREYYSRNSLIENNTFECIVSIINKYDLIYVNTMYNNPKNNLYFWNISIPVNSYNLQKPKTPYPKNFNMISQGGTHVLYLDENGNKQTLHFMELPYC